MTHLVEFQMMLWGRALQWYMKQKQSVLSLHGVTLVKLWANFVKEFQKLKLEQQSILEIKETNKKMGKTIWEYDHHF